MCLGLPFIKQDLETIETKFKVAGLALSQVHIKYR